MVESHRVIEKFVAENISWEKSLNTMFQENKKAKYLTVRPSDIAMEVIRKNRFYKLLKGTMWNRRETTCMNI